MFYSPGSLCRRLSGAPRLPHSVFGLGSFLPWEDSKMRVFPSCMFNGHWPILLIFYFINWAMVYKTVRPVLSNRCLSCLSALSLTLVYCGQTVGWINNNNNNTKIYNAHM